MIHKWKLRVSTFKVVSISCLIKTFILTKGSKISIFLLFCIYSLKMGSLGANINLTFVFTKQGFN